MCLNQVRLARRETSLSPPVKYLMIVLRRCFFCRSFTMLFLSCFCYTFGCLCLLMPSGHLLLERADLMAFVVKLSLSHWYPGSGVVLDCIDS